MSVTFNIINKIRQSSKNAQDALYAFTFPKGVIWYRSPKQNFRQYRFPSPASEPIDHEQNKMDYKTAYRDSIYNVRYSVNIIPLLKNQQLVQDPIGDTIETKLIRLRYINQNQIDDQEAIQNGIKQFEEDYGKPITQKVHQDDFGISERPVEKQNRESVAQYVRLSFTNNRDLNAEELYMDSLHDIYNPEFISLKSWDMAADDPVWRQLKLDIEFRIENSVKRREEIGQIPLFKGDPNYWQILDNSFSPENIKLTQSSAKDSLTTIDPEQLEKLHNKDYLHKYEIQHLPLKNKLI